MISNDSRLKRTMATIQIGLLAWFCCSSFDTSDAFQLPVVRRMDVFCQNPFKQGVSSPFALRKTAISSSQLASAVNNVDWGRKTVLQLQKELRSRGLSDKGSKTVLIQRLEALNTVKDNGYSRDDEDTSNRLPGSRSLNTQSVSYQSSGTATASTSYEGSGASSYATSSYTGSYPKSDEKQASKPSSSFAQNQTMVDMDSDEARRIENYLRKVKQQQRIKQQQQEQLEQPQQQQRPPQRRPRPPRPQQQQQRPPQSIYVADAGQQRAADPFMTGRTPISPPTPATEPPPPSRRQETIIDVTSTATYSKSFEQRAPPPQPRATLRTEDDIYQGAAFASSQQANWSRQSFQGIPRPPPTTPPPPAPKFAEQTPKFAEQTVTATSTTSTGMPSSKQEHKQWNGKKGVSREFFNFDKDSFLEPYNAAVEMGANAAETEEGEGQVNGNVEAVETFPDLTKNVNGNADSTITKEDVVNAVNSNKAETVNGHSAPVNRISSFGGLEQDTPKEVFFFDTQNEEAKTNGSAVEDGWTRDEPYPYKVLGIEPGATMSEIKAAYRKKAMELSIDNNAEESEEVEERLKEVVAAFQVLSGGYKKGTYEKEYQMLQRLQRRQEKEQVVDTEDEQDSSIKSPSLKDLLPSFLFEQVSLRFNSTEPALLPLQKECYTAISEGENVVLNAPADSGKTLGYLLPLLAKLPDTRNSSDTVVAAVAEEVIGGNNKRGKRRKRNRRSMLAEVQELSQPCKPTLLFVAPSKDVTLEIGKLCSQYHNAKDDAVAIVFDGVPVKKQQTLLQKSGLEIVVGTPARLLKYIEMGVLDTAGIKTVAVDEADSMVDQLEVIEDVFASMTSDDVQKVLTSVGMPADLLEFCEENMALTKTSSNFITLKDEDQLQAKAQADTMENTENETSDKEQSQFAGQIQNGLEDDEIITVEVEVSPAEAPVELNTQVLASMDHWHTATRPSDRPILTLDIIASMSPGPKIVTLFVPSDDDVEPLVSELAMFHDAQVKMLTEDMSNQARSEILDSIRMHSKNASRDKVILVTSDAAVASESNLPSADLIIQYGIPRQRSNAKLYDGNRYMTRVQRACGSNKNTQAVLLYDYEEEGRLLPGLQTEMEVDSGIVLKPRALPSPQHTLEASYLRTKAYCDNLETIPMVVESFEKQLKEDLTGMDDVDREDELVHRLAVAMAALSNPSKLKEEGP